MKGFCSYSNKDKDIAGIVKEFFKKYGIEVFLVHENIEVSAKWEKEIIQQLDECDVFIPILTNNFKKSYWTDQESGIAAYLKKIIVPLMIEKKPYGFISKYQGKRISKDIPAIYRGLLEVIKVIADKPGYEKVFRDSLIYLFAGSDSYDEANDIIDRITFFNNYEHDQIEEIMNCTINNRQINHAFKAKSKLMSMIDSYRDEIDKSLYTKFVESFK